MSLNSAHDDKAATIASAARPTGGPTTRTAARTRTLCDAADTSTTAAAATSSGRMSGTRINAGSAATMVRRRSANHQSIPPFDPDGHQRRSAGRDDDEHRDRQPRRFEQVEVDAVGVQESPSRPLSSRRASTPNGARRAGAPGGGRRTRTPTIAPSAVVIASRNSVSALTWPISKPSSLMRPRTASGDVTRSTPIATRPPMPPVSNPAQAPAAAPSSTPRVFATRL